MKYRISVGKRIASLFYLLTSSIERYHGSAAGVTDAVVAADLLQQSAARNENGLGSRRILSYYVKTTAAICVNLRSFYE